MLGNFTLMAAGDRTHISQVPKDDVERVAKAIRDRMAGAHQQGRSAEQAPAQVSAADEIRKLADLHSAGILTDEEFSAKKAQLLGL